MAQIGIFYGSTTGNTREAAQKIAVAFTEIPVAFFDVSDTEADFSPYDVLLFGSSTWGLGELQEDWERFIQKVQNADLKGKKIALFGTGDSESYPSSFGGALSKIYNIIKQKDITLIGQVPTEDYSFDDSESAINGKFVGLLLDDDNEHDKTDKRIANWVKQIKKEL